MIPILPIAVLLLLATFSTKLSARLGVPGLVVFLSLGMLFGRGALNIIHFDNYELAQQVADLCLLFVLLDGGFNTKKSVLRVAAAPAAVLATAGVALTAAVAAIGAHFILGMPLPYAMLLGAITSSTDAAAVFAIFKEKLIKPEVSATLEAESASNDPMAIILTVAMIAFIKGTLSGPSLLLLNLVWQMIGGSIVGYLVAKAGIALFNRIRLEGQSFYYVLVLGIGLTSFGLADLVGGNGFLAVFVTGIVIGNSEFVFKRGIAIFMEGVTAFAHVLLFLILGLLVVPRQALLLWHEGIVFSLILMFIARPAAVFALTAFHRFTFPERLFMSWAGIKGSVPIVLGTYPLAAGFAQGWQIFHLVFFVVLTSTVFQGSTLVWLAKRTKLFAGFKREAPHSLELISAEHSRVEVAEYVIKPTSPVIGKSICNLNLPRQALVVAIVRGSDVVTPRGDTTIEAGDLLFVLAHAHEKEQVRACLFGTTGDVHSPCYLCDQARP